MRPVLNAAALLPVFFGAFFKERTNNNGVLQTPKDAAFWVGKKRRKNRPTDENACVGGLTLKAGADRILRLASFFRSLSGCGSRRPLYVSSRPAFSAAK